MLLKFKNYCPPVLVFWMALCVCQVACSPKVANPPAQGFNAAASDAKAVAIADEVMVAMGGRQAWDATHYISWNFFGSRTLFWDKYTGQCRIEWQKRPLKVIVNVNTGTGRVAIDGVEQTQPDTLAKYLDMGKRAWINDSYWLLMPFKLKDSGVTLRYLGEAKTEKGAAADLLQMTFAGVGVTPDNKYHVWVDKQSRLVTQWAYFPKFTDEKPQFINPWNDYKRYGAVLISGDRGRGEVNLLPIEVLTEVPAGTFEKW